jgi:hypothetical protein
VQVLKDFFRDLDRRWAARPQAKIRLRIIGSAALMLQADYARGTKDSDVLETALLTGEIKERLLDLAGPGTQLHHRHKVYLDLVHGGLPFLPQIPLCHLLGELNQSLQCFELEVLDIVDVVVSKLKRFSASDVSDIEAMADRGLIDATRLVERFRCAVDVYAMDARAEDLPGYVISLHRVERDILFVPETPIDLPGWIEHD